LLGAALLAALAPDGMGWLYDWAAVALIFPLLVWLGASSEADGAIGSAGLGLGYLSYPLYILQVPLLAVLDRLLAELFGWVETADTAAYFAVAAVWTIGLALIAARCFDDPVRAWLTRRYVGRTVPVAAQTAP
jgi:peptidoglycan/LPS O-acetylase OafA/YrhL